MIQFSVPVGDPQSLATMASILVRAGESLVKAVRGAEYIE